MAVKRDAGPPPQHAGVATLESTMHHPALPSRRHWLATGAAGLLTLGLAVPGMPVGSPGMDGPEYQGRKDPYDVLLLLADGSARVYQGYR